MAEFPQLEMVAEMTLAIELQLQRELQRGRGLPWQCRELGEPERGQTTVDTNQRANIQKDPTGIIWYNMPCGSMATV